MLEMDDTVRMRLVASGALSQDADGEDVFVGLTHAESQFFCTYEPSLGDGHATAEAALYIELQQKHLAARSAELVGDLREAGLP